MIISTGRVEAFSDGVITIAITIMVIELRLDIPTYQNLTSKTEQQALINLLPHFLSYALSFIMLGIMWVNHHHLYHMIRHVDGKLLWHNLHLLFWLALVPFSTSLMGKSPMLPESTAVYGFILFMASLAFALSRRYAMRHNLMHVTKTRVLNETIRRINRRARIKTYVGMAMYFISIPLSFAYVYLTYVCFLVPAVLFFIPEKVDDKALAKVLFESFEKDSHELEKQ
jgi:uncharacterized membrane protein